eukprot:SAG11_NODE_560_length_8528_cov_4.697710_10_plen_338_part_00
MRSGAQTAGRRLQAQHEAQQRAEERTVRRRAEAVALVQQQTVQGEGWLRDRAALDGVRRERWTSLGLRKEEKAQSSLAQSAARAFTLEDERRRSEELHSRSLSRMAREERRRLAQRGAAREARLDEAARRREEALQEFRRAKTAEFTFRSSRALANREHSLGVRYASGTPDGALIHRRCSDCLNLNGRSPPAGGMRAQEATLTLRVRNMTRTDRARRLQRAEEHRKTRVAAVRRDGPRALSSTLEHSRALSSTAPVFIFCLFLLPFPFLPSLPLYRPTDRPTHLPTNLPIHLPFRAAGSVNCLAGHPSPGNQSQDRPDGGGHQAAKVADAAARAVDA